MKLSIGTSLFVFLIIEHSVQCFHSSNSNAKQLTRRATASRDIDHDIDTTETVPYVVARGDGSVGGGGVSMPRDLDSQLVRPKVGAEMPKGRPSWFHVPAPSQGKLDYGTAI
jgi:hypothetical protein